MDETTQKQATTSTQPKKEYRPPVLQVLGKLIELTAGGPGSKNENFPDPLQKGPSKN